MIRVQSGNVTGPATMRQIGTAIVATAM